MKCPNCLLLMKREEDFESWGYQVYICKNRDCEDLGLKRYILQSWKKRVI